MYQKSSGDSSFFKKYFVYNMHYIVLIKLLLLYEYIINSCISESESLNIIVK